MALFPIPSSPIDRRRCSYLLHQRDQVEVGMGKEEASAPGEKKTE